MMTIRLIFCCLDVIIHSECSRWTSVSEPMYCAVLPRIHSTSRTQRASGYLFKEQIGLVCIITTCLYVSRSERVLLDAELPGKIQCDIMDGKGDLYIALPRKPGAPGQDEGSKVFRFIFSNVPLVCRRDGYECCITCLTWLILHDFCDM